MINWRFILNPDDAYPITMEEPAGWSDAELVLQRDQVYHGVSVVFSNRTLELQGEAAAYVKEQYELYGTDAQVVLRIILECEDETEDYSEDFMLDFSTYQELCGSECRVSIGFTEQGCFLQFRNNFDKKVDLNNNKAFDGTTDLTQYGGLGTEITLPAMPLRQQDKALGDDETDTSVLTDDPDWDCAGCVNGSWFGWILPPLPEIKYSALGLFNPNPTWEHIRYYGANNIPPYQVHTTVNLDELSAGGVNCEVQEATLSFRAKGNVVIDATDWDAGFIMRLKVFRLPAGLDETVAGNWQELYSQDAVNVFQSSGSGGTFPYDLSDSFPVTLAQGDKLTYGFFYSIGRYYEVNSITLNQDASTEENPTNFFDLAADVVCPDTTAQVFMIYETLSRIAEAITDKCLKIESEYYGRTDSQPDAYDEDGCGGLRCLTSGLYIRKAVNPTFFQSMKDAIDGLRCIDNIGFGLMRNDADEQIMKIEKAKYFYQDIEVLRLPSLSLATLKVAMNEIYGLIKIGYDKWQPEAINGLDEFNTQREYRVDLKTARATLDLVSKFIAGSYLIEQERRQSFAATGAADTAYDDSTFIMCLDRQAYMQYIIERGNILDDANIMFPAEVYNYRISPIRNLMRWFRSIAGEYRDHTANEIIFSAGTGNILAEGRLDDDCSLEAEVLSEQENLEVAKFKDADEAQPMIRPESITFEYPMSLADFKALRANPYGFISYECGVTWFEGHLISVKYKPSNGIATFDLRKKYE